MSLPNPKKNPPKARVKDQPKADVPHYARVVGVVDIGIQPSYEYMGKIKEETHKVEIVYELPNSLMADGRPHWLSEGIPVNFNVSDNDPSFTATLMKRVFAINPSETEYDEKVLERLIGKPCQVTPYLNKGGYAKLSKDSVSGVPTGTSIGELSNSSFIFDWDTATADDFNNLKSPLTKKKIQESVNFTGSKLAAKLSGEKFTEDVPF